METLRLKLYVTAIFAVLALASCHKDKEPWIEGELSMKISRNSLYFKADSKNVVGVRVECNVPSWSVDSDAPWCHVDKFRSDSISISVENNSTSDVRRALLTFTYQDSVKTMTVVQDNPQGSHYNLHKQDSVALAAIYASCGGVNWNRKAYWMTNNPINYWEGVHLKEIDGLQRVAMLSLGDNNLVGTLPSEVGFLTELTALHIYTNSLTSLGTGLTNTTKLELLSIGGNDFQIVDGRRLMPEVISTCTSIRKLYATGCRFTDLPTSLSALKELRILRLIANDFNGSVPAVIFSFTKLDSLSLNQNNFNGPIPHGFSNLKSLRQLDAVYCGFSGDIPASFAGMSELNNLNLGGNKDLSNLGVLASLKKLHALTLYGVDMKGTFPSFVTELPELDTLCLGECNISGAIPENLSNLKKLKYIDLSCQTYSGTEGITAINNSIGQLSELRYLELASNKLTTAPESIGSLTKLDYLGLSNNQIATLPDAFFNVKTKILSLSGNKLTVITATLSNLSATERLDISYNQITILPQGIDKLSKLVVLNLSNNVMSGTIPETWGNLSLLTTLSLGNNNLTGSLPASLPSLQGLKSINVANNRLSGDIPKSWLDDWRWTNKLIILGEENTKTGWFPSYSICPQQHGYGFNSCSAPGDVDPV